MIVFGVLVHDKAIKQLMKRSENIATLLGFCQSAVISRTGALETKEIWKKRTNERFMNIFLDRIPTMTMVHICTHRQFCSISHFSQIAQLENQIARDELTTATKQAENHHIREQLKELDDEIEERNTLITKLEAEIHHATIQVERKQGSLDLLNRKLDRLLHEAGVCHIRIRCIKRSQKLIFLIIAYL